MRKPFSPWRNAFICLGLALLILFLALVPGSLWQPSVSVAASPSLTERRGVWLTNVASAVLFTPGSVNRAIKQLSQLHFNTVYPVVWNRGYTFYPSGLAQRMIGQEQEPLLSWISGGSDVLKVMVKESHRHGLQVIPWFEYGLMIPENSPLAKKHPDWLTYSQQGTNLPYQDELEAKNQVKSGNFLQRWRKASYNKRVSQLAWLNPLHPEVQQFIKGLMLEVVMGYDVDGVQLDDHFGMPVELGYDPLTIKLYQQEHGGKSPPKDTHNAEWMRWRAAKLTALMADIVKSLKIAKSSIKISLSPNSHDFSYQNYLQDWQAWVKRGLIDELVLQVYREDLDGFKGELMKPAVQFARQKIPVSVGILSGTLNSPVTMKKIQEQVKIVRKKGFDGVSFFYWESLWGYFSPESPYKRRQAFEKMFIDKIS
ncbi:glycoside hydrolase family 10 protein [Crocosphaera sp. XPORK-15E]|uniref:glycoside hydrolase family 10 protein n=1 Tax=Crocosphaera sp. XPORK-15E TaxID=3110247 RepID=UPI002B1F5E63|nr:family 10 glycosylhydrolase [Crocosphaera sp. XPORK-15E]MEA5533765.1 family 10 glycosylhydrolase [Crocosphaera sp. XPORK-15E]